MWKRGVFYKVDVSEEELFLKHIAQPANFDIGMSYRWGSFENPRAGGIGFTLESFLYKILIFNNSLSVGII